MQRNRKSKKTGIGKTQGLEVCQILDDSEPIFD